MAESHPTFEERVMIIRDKIARENFEVPDEVIDYIAHLYEAPQALKGALINVAAHAMRRHEPVTLDVAKRLLEGIRQPAGHGSERGAMEGLSVADIDALPLEEDVPFDFVDGDMVDMEAPAASSGVHTTTNLESSSETLDFVASRDSETLEPSGASHIPAPEYLAAVADASMTYTNPVDRIEVDPVEQSYNDLLGTDESVEVFAVQEELLLELVEDDYSPELETVLPVMEFETVQSPSEPSAAPSALEQYAKPCNTSGGDVICSEVFFAPMRTEKKRSFVERAGVALKRAGLESVIEPGDYVAIKLHFGERGNTGFVSPIYVREVVRLIKELGGKPFLTDSNTLYSGMRANAADHIQCAIQNGFSWATVEAPIIIADGLHGHDALDVRIDGKHFESVRIGSAAVEADAMVVISHVKGHGEAGFGGAVKNVGMGLGCRSAKQRMHSDVKPRVTFDKCTKCQRCLQWCPVSCITMSEAHGNKAYIHKNQCIGCGECVAACAYGAIAINWETEPAALQEKMVEHAAGVLRGKKDKMIYLSFLTNITPECDCWSFSDAPIVPDIGLLASRDMIAIDQASYDLITDALGNAHSRGDGLEAGQDKFKAMHGIDGSIVMSYGEEFGLGTRNYTLKPIG